jgi:peptidoglycan DL-endopeptidase LytF
MTRRDIIMIATLANMGVLAILFVLAFRSEKSQELPISSEIAYRTMEEHALNPLVVPISLSHETRSEPIDEVDVALEELAPITNETHSEERYTYVVPETPPTIDKPKPDEPHPIDPNPTDKHVEVIVKRGDALEKMARGNGTTVKAIMDVNHLTTDRLKIGQVLRIPVLDSPQRLTSTQAAVSEDNQYYTLKSGDSPWKIAKQFNIDVSKLMELNDLNEENARKLKVGDRVRVK